MSELTQLKVVDLHQIIELQAVQVRPDITLRPMQNDDAQALLTILSEDPTIRTRVSTASRMPDTAGVHQEVLNYKADPELIRYVILKEAAVIGLISLWADADGVLVGHTPQPNTYGFGYFLSPPYRGQGVITDSLQALMAKVQQNTQVDAFIAFCEHDNEQSIAVLQKLGFIPKDESFTEQRNGWQEYLYEKRLTS